MNDKACGFRRHEAGIVFLCAMCLMVGLGAVGESGRERAKRLVCLRNLGQLTLAWTLYADENDGKIVNGAGGIHYTKTALTSDGAADGIVERAWVGRAWGRNWNNRNVADTGFAEEQKKQAVRQGALWPLVADERLYQCPVARPHEFVNYAVVDAMNGMVRAGTVSQSGHHPYTTGRRIGRTTLWIKDIEEIDTPGPAERMVFIDEGALTPDSFGVHYLPNPWWDDPPVRHSDGATVSWADGHASHLQWQGPDTIERGRDTAEYYRGGGWTPWTEGGIEDLQGFKRAIWGRLFDDPIQ